MATFFSERASRPRNPRGQGDLLRAEILAAALRLLRRSGTTAALSLRAVAREAGVAANSLYLHFADRDDLVKAVLDEVYQARAGLLRATATAHDRDDPFDRLRSICLAWCQYALDHPAEYRLIAEVRQEWDDPDLLHPGHEAFLLLDEAVRRCQTAAAPIADSLLVAACIWVALHGLVDLRWSKPNFAWPALEIMLEALLTGLVPGPTPSWK